MQTHHVIIIGAVSELILLPDCWEQLVNVDEPLFLELYWRKLHMIFLGILHFGENFALGLEVGSERQGHNVIHLQTTIDR